MVWLGEAHTDHDTWRGLHDGTIRGAPNLAVLFSRFNARGLLPMRPDRPMEDNDIVGEEDISGRQVTGTDFAFNMVQRAEWGSCMLCPPYVRHETAADRSRGL